MLDNPDKFIDAFIDAGADQITIHVEPDYPIEATLKKIKSHGVKCGIVSTRTLKLKLQSPILNSATSCCS